MADGAAGGQNFHTNDVVVISVLPFVYGVLCDPKVFSNPPAPIVCNLWFMIRIPRGNISLEGIGLMLHTHRM